MFDSTTRSLLQRFVERARRLLEDEFTRQLRGVYGMDPESGAVAEMAALAHLSDAERAAALLLRETLAHYRPAHADDRAALERILREQSFTVLNRLAALRLAEARGSLMPCVSAGYSSQGFQLYAQLAGPALGETYGAYRAYLFALADELAEALPALFDRFAPQGRLFPGETALLDVLRLLNAPELTPLWDADETVGWIYQYFNSADERRAMRKASAAPRTSRELAVRNQFFTPRYVVEFLVDECFPSPLPSQRGGGWGEGRGKIRDPRTLLLLDPACGSMHFGLYAFDVLLRRYEEAWDAEAAGATLVDADGAPTPPLRAEFADRDAFVRAAPKLIVENNICGVDIDPRAAQIAAAALWLRAQRAWHEAGVRSAARPRVGRGRVVAAVAPPHDPALQAQFEARLGEDDRRRFAAVLALLRGLPELGLLLRAEVEIERAMRTAGGQDLPIFNEYEDWAAAEARIMQALRDYAGAAGYRARLFVGDALDCLRLIDLARERYDAVVMNPPFGEAAAGTRKRLERDYPNSKQDLLAMFVERGLELLRPGGRLGAITSRTGFFSSSFERWRREVVRKKSQPRVFADLGHGVMDGAMVEAAAYVLQKSAAVIPNASPGEAEGPLLLCLRLLHERDKAAALADVRARLADGERDPRAFSVNPASFDAVPGAPFAYWVSDAVRGLFKTLPPFESDGRTAKQGLATADDFRFLRLWWEAPADEHGARWFPFAKGGAYSPFYVDLPLVVNFTNSGEEISNALNDAGKVRSNIWMLAGTIRDYFFRPGLTWPARPHVRGSFAHVTRNCLFGHVGPMAFTRDDRHWADLAILNSDSYIYLLHLLMPRGGVDSGQTLKYEVGYVTGVPLPRVDADQSSVLERLASSGWINRYKNDRIHETSHAFLLPSALRGRVGAWDPAAADAELARLQSAIDDIAFDLYGFSPADRTAAEEALRRPSAPVDAAILEGDDAAPDDEPADDEDESESDAAADLLSWAVGVAFGRFDIRLATGERAAPPEPDPFDPLPPRSPGMLPPGDAPFHAHGGLLVDDPGHRHDLARLVEEVLERAGLPVPDDVRARLRKSFFEQHLKRYSRSRRKAPIYWPLSSPSGEYTLWLYWPRLSSQTLYAALNDFLRPAIALAEEELANLTPGPSPEGRGAGGEVRLRVRLDDLLALQQSILALVDRYRPHPDDGVQISAAPLWALFRHKPWQKILKDTWSKLEKGQYDWAHLAMHTWPERVTKKCESDKSLAIAHGVGR